MSNGRILPPRYAAFRTYSYGPVSKDSHNSNNSSTSVKWFYRFARYKEHSTSLGFLSHASFYYNYVFTLSSGDTELINVKLNMENQFLFNKTPGI